MRLPMFLVAMAAAVVTLVAPAQQLYDSPTFSQVERLVGAVQEAGGDPAAYTAAVARAARSLYDRPTFDQVERLISEVRVNGASAAGDMAELRTNVSDVVSTLAAATNDISTMSGTIATATNDIAALSGTLAAATNAISAATNDISTLSGTLATATNDISTISGTLATATNDISTLSGTLATATNDIAAIEDALAPSDGAVQLGTGTNSTPHTLKFEDVTVVKDGHVVGSAPDPREVEPEPPGDLVDYTYVMSVSPGSMTTLLPTNSLDGGSDLGIRCSGMRNYTVYYPNEPEVCAGLPIRQGFMLPDGVRHATVGPALITRLPCRVVMEQPYSGLVVANVTELDDGSDWTPSVTNSCIAFDISNGKFVCLSDGGPSLSAWSVQGTALHCATEFKMSYPLSGGGTNTVDLISVPAGQTYIDGSVYGQAPSFVYVPPEGEGPDVVVEDGASYLPVVLTYRTARGSAEYRTTLDVLVEE